MNPDPRQPSRWPIAAAAAAVAAALVPLTAAAQADTEPVIITGSTDRQRLFDAPYALGVVDADTLRAAGPMVNLSEAASRIPGLVANLRHNYAQDLQISSRGFGARASFGVRGLRLYTDGIPAAGPDGQGQVSHMDLAGAERLEVLRGPFSALYGNSSGGVIALISADARERALHLGVDAGSLGLRQLRLGVDAPLDGGFNLKASLARFETDGPRPHAEASRTLANVRLGWQGGADRVVAVANALDQPAQDPLGLTRAQFEADPHQTAPQATQFDTRKTTRQSQAGVQWQHLFGGDGPLTRSTLMAYAGERAVTQWQSIPVATQAGPRHPGGVIDFDRRYGGIDARLLWRGERWRAVTGLSLDEQREDRRGYENFVGVAPTQQLGVTGRLRRDERNGTQSAEMFGQLEWDLTPTVTAAIGARHGRLRFEATDFFLANGDDSGRLAFGYTTPVASVRWQPAQGWQLYASAGRGHESPTLNELAYRADGSAGFNDGLSAMTSRQVELGLKWRADGLALDAAIFDAATDDEIGVQSNAGGRASFRNVGRTTRRGAELSLRWTPAPTWRATVAASVLDATYRDGFLVCAATPCSAPTVPVPAGNRIAGTVPRHGFAELAWMPAPWELAVEARGQGRQAVNDTNSDFAAGFGLLALRARWQLTLGDGRLELMARVDNLADRIVAGSVIVNEANQRYFEPAPGRTVSLSARWTRPF